MPGVRSGNAKAEAEVDTNGGGKRHFKKALKELMSDLDGRDYGHEVRAAVKDALKSTGMGLPSSRGGAAGFLNLPQMKRVPMSGDAGGEEGQLAETGVRRWEIEESGQWRRGGQAAGSQPIDVAALVRRFGEEQFSYSEDEYLALNLDTTEQLQWSNDDDSAESELPAKRKRGESAEVFPFDAKSTALLFDLVRTHGENWYAVHDRFVTICKDERFSVDRIVHRYFNVCRRVLMHRRERLLSTAERSNTEAAKRAAELLAHLIETHPVMQPVATARSQVGVGFAAVAPPASEGMRFYDAEDTVRAQEYRKIVAEAQEKLKKTDVRITNWEAELKEEQDTLRMLKERHERDVEPGTIIEETGALRKRSADACERFHQVLPPGSYSRVEDILTMHFPPKAPGFMREAETAIEKHLEDYLDSDSDEAFAEVAGIRTLLVQNSLLLRHLRTKQVAEANINKVEAAATRIRDEISS